MAKIKHVYSCFEDITRSSRTTYASDALARFTFSIAFSFLLNSVAVPFYKSPFFVVPIPAICFWVKK